MEDEDWIIRDEYKMKYNNYGSTEYKIKCTINPAPLRLIIILTQMLIEMKITLSLIRIIIVRY